MTQLGTPTEAAAQPSQPPEPSKPPALRLDGVGRSYGALTVLDGLDLTVADGQILAVLGPSGSGKTTLLRVIVGLDRADAGAVHLAGRVVDDRHSWVRPEDRGVGYVPQEGALFPHLTVAANIGFGVRRGRDRTEAVAETLQLVGLVDLAGRYPHQLSGGQRQRVALARALAIKPRLVVLDEPFSSLDAALRAGLRAEVAGVLRRAGATAVVVTHDQDEALSIADEVAVLRGGRFVQIGAPADLLAAPVDPDIAAFLETGTLLTVAVDHGRAVTPWGDVAVAGSPNLGDRAVILIRPGQIRVHTAPQQTGRPARVTGSEYRGGVSLVRLRAGSDDDQDGPDLLAGSDEPLATGQAVWIEIIGPISAWPAT